MLKSKWARFAAVGLLGLSLPVLAAVKSNASHGKVALATQSHVVKTTTPAIKSTSAKPAAKSSVKTTAKPKIVAHKKLTTKKTVRKSTKPLATKKSAKSSTLSLKKPVKSSKLSAKKPVATKTPAKTTTKSHAGKTY